MRIARQERQAAALSGQTRATYAWSAASEVLASKSQASCTIRAPMAMRAIPNLPQAALTISRDQMNRQHRIISLASQWELQRVLKQKGLNSSKGHRAAPRLREQPMPVAPIHRDAPRRDSSWLRPDPEDPSTVPRALALARKRGLQIGLPSASAPLLGRRARSVPESTMSERSLALSVSRQIEVICGSGAPLAERLPMTRGFNNLSLAKQARLHDLLHATSRQLKAAKELASS